MCQFIEWRREDYGILVYSARTVIKSTAPGSTHSKMSSYRRSIHLLKRQNTRRLTC